MMKNRKAGVTLATILCGLALCLKAGAAAVHKGDGDHMPLIPNLSSIIFLQQTPESRTMYREFYANNVELEPFTLIMCGKRIVKDGEVKFIKVDPKEIKNVRFTADPLLSLDKQYNRNNTIPVITNPDADNKNVDHENDYRRPDLNEPTFSAEDANKRRVLLIYTEDSNYHRLYQKEGFILGGIWSPPSSNAYRSSFVKRPYHTFSAYEDGANRCFPDQRQGVGETVVRLYLLATKALQTTSTVVLYADAYHHVPEDDSNPSDPVPAHNETIEEGPIRYRIPLPPTVTVNDLNLKQRSYNQSDPYSETYYSLFTSDFEKDNSKWVEEQKGFGICTYPLGAPFHDLHEYGNLDINYVGYKACKIWPKVGPTDCDVHYCKRRINISSISSTKIKFHDMFAVQNGLVMGGKCPHRSGAYRGGLTIKPLLRSDSNGKYDTSAGYYLSRQGGVGAYFYPRKSHYDKKKPFSDGVTGGNENTYYIYTFAWGPTMSGPGLDCQWNRASYAKGHDVYGNPVHISFVPAVGEAQLSIKDVSG